MEYDLMLAGGTLVDTAQGINDVLDVAFREGRVAAVETNLNRAEAANVMDCSGRIVTPGMIDLHVHVFWGASFLGISADENCVAKGVTTAVDAGSAGADTFPGFRKYVIDVSDTRLLAQLNISSQGMLSMEIGELDDLRYASVPKAIAMAEQHRDLILGIKVRLSRYKQVSEAAGIRPLYHAREAADALGLPIMVHPQEAWCESLDEILAVMRDRDILTHCYHGYSHGILDSDGLVRKSVRDAMERGVVFDVGHGSGSFSWEVAERALSQGVQPQTISSDLHKFSLNGPAFDLATTVTKFLHLGLTVPDALRKVTETPARVIRMADQIGTLRVGAWGDAVVFELEEGEFELLDAHEQVRLGRQKLVPKTVIRAGKPYAPRSNKPIRHHLHQ